MAERRSREEISDWARILREAEDNSNLYYEPREAEKKIWDAILYLEGVDLKDGPDTYLHINEDFNKYYKETF
ncbi:MAG: DNA-binding protein [Deltaproteobacteria bacterium]|nr:DNA-binding protein [Deltaproteobacteria bacterium]